MTKKSDINIFEVAQKAEPLSEPKALDSAIDAIQVYLDLITNNKEKINDFKDLINNLFSRTHKAS